MKGNGILINDMGEVMKGIQMETFIRESSKWVKLMEKEDINGPKTEKYTMENGLKE